MFFVFLLSIVLLLSMISFFVVTFAFPKLRSYKGIFIWLFVTLLFYSGYFFIRIYLNRYPDIDYFLRLNLVNISMFWLLVQCFIIILLPIWLGIYFIKSNHAKTAKILTYSVVFLILTISVKFVYFPTTWRVREFVLPVKDFMTVFDGFKIAQMSDTHVIYKEDLILLKEKLTAVKNSNADILIVTGDIADTKNLLEPTIKMFKDFEQYFPSGMWFILGNHEYIRGIDDFLAMCKKYDIKVLRNEGTVLSYNKNDFYLTGIDYPFAPEWFNEKKGAASFNKDAAEASLDTVLQKRPKDMLTILGSHHPIIFEKAFKERVFLTLSGHTHAYQIGINDKPLGIFGENVWGLYGKDNSFGYVTSGSGEWFPLRVGAPQEVVIFTLKKVE